MYAIPTANCYAIQRFVLYRHRLERTYTRRQRQYFLPVSGEEVMALPKLEGEVSRGVVGEDFCIIWTAAVILVRKHLLIY